MPDATPQAAQADSAQKSPLMSAKSFSDVLRSLIGRPITIVYTQSYERAAMGAQLTEGFYKGKIVGVEDTFITVATEFAPKVKNAEPEPVRQFVPITSVTRVTVMKSEILLHL
jgi:hypothetical protein